MPSSKPRRFPAPPASARPRRCRAPSSKWHIDDRQGVLPAASAVAEGRQRVGGLSRLRDEQSEAARLEGRFAITELGRHIDLDRDARQALEPVFRDQAGQIGRPARRDRDPLQALKSNGRSNGRLISPEGEVDVMGERAAHHFRLLVDLLRHEVAVVALVGDEGAREDLLPRARPSARRHLGYRALPGRMAQSPSSRY